MSEIYAEFDRRSGSAQRITKLLKDYKRPIPQDFVARILGWNTSDVEDQLRSMEEAGLVRRDGDKVELVWRTE